MKRYLAASVIFAGLAAAQPALSADLPRRAAPMPYAPVVVALNWTGFYIGGNLGYGWGDGDGTIRAGAAIGPYSGSGDGFLGGLQAGYNWHGWAGGWVVGIETDIQASGGKGNASGFAGPAPAAVFVGSQKAPWFGTIRGRLGYTFDQTLVYITGGGVYGRSELNGASNVIAFPYSVSEDYWTWTVGAGVEQALWASRWSAKLEYLYVGSPNNLAIPPNTAVDGDLQSHIVRAGVNYRF